MKAKLSVWNSDKSNAREDQQRRLCAQVMEALLQTDEYTICKTLHQLPSPIHENLMLLLEKVSTVKQQDLYQVSPLANCSCLFAADVCVSVNSSVHS